MLHLAFICCAKFTLRSLFFQSSTDEYINLEQHQLSAATGTAAGQHHGALLGPTIGQQSGFIFAGPGVWSTAGGAIADTYLGGLSRWGTRNPSDAGADFGGIGGVGAGSANFGFSGGGADGEVVGGGGGHVVGPAVVVGGGGMGPVAGGVAGPSTGASDVAGSDTAAYIAAGAGDDEEAD